MLEMSALLLKATARNLTQIVKAIIRLLKKKDLLLHVISCIRSKILFRRIYFLLPCQKCEVERCPRILLTSPCTYALNPLELYTAFCDVFFTLEIFLPFYAICTEC